MRWIVQIIIVILSVIGLITLRSVAPSLLPLQTLFVVLGLVVYFISWKIGFDKWSAWRWSMYLGLVLLLILTLLFANITRGTAQWLTLAGINIQGSQLAVPVIGLTLAHFTAKAGLKTLKNLLLFGVFALIPATFIALAPDLGTTLILLIALFGVAFSSDLKISWLLGAVAIAVLVSFFAWNLVLAPYQKDRITSFVRPTADLQGAGYNARQALIAVGSGQLLGRGLGQGVQSHLKFLPERQTDFIFASLAEEWGFIGASLVLLLYFVLVGVYLSKAWSLKTGAEYYFLIVIIFFFATQVMVNIGMNMQLMPITGITLPFVSYGGSSFLSFCFLCGIAQSILDKKQQKKMLHFS
jgi:rod shape determining protein RodA